MRRLAYENTVRGLMLLVDAAETAAATAVTLDAFGTKNLKASIIKLDSATRIVEREPWATIVPADPKEKPIEMASDGAGKWLFGQ